MERAKVDVIDSQRDARAFVLRLPYSQHRALTMNTFLPKAMMLRQFYIDRQELAHTGQGVHDIAAMPGDQDAAPADILRIHCTLGPDARRSDVARQLDLDTWTLSLVDMLHDPGYITGLYLLAIGNINISIGVHPGW
jgi:hypothetical protein